VAHEEQLSARRRVPRVFGIQLRVAQRRHGRPRNDKHDPDCSATSGRVRSPKTTPPDRIAAKSVGSAYRTCPCAPQRGDDEGGRPGQADGGEVRPETRSPAAAAFAARPTARCARPARPIAAPQPAPTRTAVPR
jgi:hypothetical protein